MKLRLIKLLNKILIFINKIFKPKQKYTREDLEKEINKLKRRYKRSWRKRMNKNEVEDLRKAFNLKDSNDDTYEEEVNKKISLKELLKKYCNELKDNFKEIFKEEPRPKQRAEIHLLDGEIIEIKGFFDTLYDVYRVIDGFEYDNEHIKYRIPTKLIKYIKIEDIKGEDKDVN